MEAGFGMLSRMGIGFGRSGLAAAIACVLALGFGEGAARDIHVAPQGAPRIGGADGSEDRPWPSLGDALKLGGGQAGDVLLLRAGRHGPLDLRGVRLGGRLTVAAAPGERAVVDSIRIVDSRKVTIRGLAVWPPGHVSAKAAKVPNRKKYLVRVSKSEDVVLERLDVRSIEAAADYLTWTVAEWGAIAQSGVLLMGGARNTIRQSRFRGVRNGVNSLDSDVAVVGNRIEGFSGDGMVGIGDRSVYRGNLVKDCIKTDDNHDDGFQSWSRGPKGKSGRGVVADVVLDRNRIIEWTGPARHPLRCVLQGIGMFDGVYRNWTISNNLVVVSAWHGISVYGGDGVRIVNNTVAPTPWALRNAPRIMQQAHKDGRPARGGVIVNNIAVAFTSKAPPGALIELANLVVRDPRALWRDPAGGDYRLKTRAPGRDAADARFAPSADIDGLPRPIGAGPDIGAFEAE